MRWVNACAASILIAMALVADPVAAQEGSPGGVLEQVGFEQRLGAQVPGDLTFRDERGAQVRLGDYFQNRPVVLMLGYLGCPNLCSLTHQGMTASFNGLAFDIGDEFTVLSVSIDPAETPEVAAMKKREYLREYDRPGAEEGWHFLTGETASIDRLADAVGYSYAYDPSIEQFAHPAGLVVLTPQGEVARYFYGIEYDPNDLRLGLVEASQHQIGSPIDQVLLRCYSYNPETGQYTAVVMEIVRLAGSGTALLLGLVVIVLFRRERKQRAEVA